MIRSATAATRDVDASFDYCRRLAKRTAKNFYYSFLTLPGDVRRDMCALYAYMRICDDLGDDVAVAAETRRSNLTAWRRAVTQALTDGDSIEMNHPVLPALADMVDRRGVPVSALLDVIDGVEMDLASVTYEAFADLEDYCYHVAGAVGLCCIHVWGYSGDQACERAVECGLAFQLTNILRDLAEDARMGRVYLPAEDFDRFDYRQAELASGVIDVRFRRLMAFQVERARDYYHRSAPLANDVSRVGRPVLAAMRNIYGGLLDEIERRDFDVFSRRVTLPSWKKLAMTAQAMLCAR